MTDIGYRMKEDRGINEGDRILVTGKHPEWGGSLAGLKWKLPPGGLTGTVRLTSVGSTVFDPDGADLDPMNMTFTHVLDFDILHRNERREGERRTGDRRRIEDGPVPSVRWIDDICMIPACGCDGDPHP